MATASDATPNQSDSRLATKCGARRTAFIHISRPTHHEKVTHELARSAPRALPFCRHGLSSALLLVATFHFATFGLEQLCSDALQIGAALTLERMTGSPARSGFVDFCATATLASRTPSRLRTSKPPSVSAVVTPMESHSPKCSSMRAAALYVLAHLYGGAVGELAVFCDWGLGGRPGPSAGGAAGFALAQPMVCVGAENKVGNSQSWRSRPCHPAASLRGRVGRKSSLLLHPHGSSP